MSSELIIMSLSSSAKGVHMKTFVVSYFKNGMKLETCTVNVRAANFSIAERTAIFVDACGMTIAAFADVSTVNVDDSETNTPNVCHL